jgi:DNA-binding beta-propeller fold protein YncE
MLGFFIFLVYRDSTTDIEFYRRVRMRAKIQKNLQSIVVTIFCIMTTLALPASAVAIEASFLYTLSDFTGPFSIGGGRIFVDKERGEAYVVYQNIVRVFNENGLEIYRFGESNDLGMIASLAVDRDGTIFSLSYKEGGGYGIIRCNYRGEPTGRIEITGLTSGFSDFAPSHMVYREGQFYLADTRSLRIVVADMNGRVQKTYDLVPLLELKEEQERGDIEMGGFSVDKDGNMLFTLPVLFTATVLSPDGKVSSFGRPGSIPGKFGVVSDIISDNKGNYLVADKLKCVISVFDRSFQFLTEFGGRGNGPGNLIVPQVLAMDGSDRLYVIQAGNRGVSVFRMLYN